MRHTVVVCVCVCVCINKKLNRYGDKNEINLKNENSWTFSNDQIHMKIARNL